MLLAVAAALAVASFALGVAVGGSDDAQAVDFVVEMNGDEAPAAATLTVYELDEAGNWPMEIAIEGLASRRERKAVRALADEGRRARSLLRKLRHG